MAGRCPGGGRLGGFVFIAGRLPGLLGFRWRSLVTGCACAPRRLASWRFPWCLLLRLFLLPLALGFLLAQPFFDAFAIVTGLLQFWVAFQRQVVSLQRGVELPVQGQGIAPVVVIGGFVAKGEALGGFGVFFGQVQGVPLAAGIGEMPGGLFRMAFDQQALALLVTAQPQIVEGMAGYRHEQQWQAEQPAAPPRARGEQQQRQE